MKIMAQSAAGDIDKEVATVTCMLCLKHGLDTESEGYCKTCRFHLCKRCITDHREIPALNAHVLVGTEESEIISSSDCLDTIPTTCALHNGRTLDSFCPDHDEVGCDVCVVINHRSCQKVAQLKEVVRNIKESEEFKQTKTYCDKIMKYAASESKYRTDNIQRLNKDKDRILAEIGKTEDEIVAKVRETAEAARQEVSEKHDACVKAVKSDEKALETLVTSLSEGCRKIEKLFKTKFTDVQAFIGMKATKRLVKDAEQVTRVLSEDWAQIELTFACDSKIKHVATELVSFGEVVESNKHNLNYLAKQDRKVSVKIDSDNKPCEIMGICHTDDGQLIISDFNNKRLKRLDVKYNVTDYIDLPGGPVSMCVTGKQEVALALREEKTVQFVSFGEILTLTSHFTTDQKCSGICYDPESEELYLSYWGKINQDGTVAVVRKNGEVLRKIGEGLLGPCQILYLLSEKVVVVVDKTYGVKAMDKSGSLLWSPNFDVSVIKRPWGLCKFKWNGFLVTGVCSCNVVQLDTKGNFVAEIIDKNAGLESPSVLFFNVDTNTLMVGGQMDNIVLYKLSRSLSKK